MRSVVAIAIVAITVAANPSAVASGPTAAVSHSESKPRDVEAVGLDYAFQVPAQLPAGRTVFHFRNQGKVRHELSIVRLKPGATIDQLIKLAKEGASTQSVLDGAVGLLFADPGKRSTSALTTDLVAGQYAVVCTLRDTPTAVHHFEMGMYSVINVPGPKVQPAASVKADTIVATEYAFRYPRTLSPGRHTLVFRNEGTVRHEVNIALLKQGVSLEDFMKVRRANGNARALIDEGLGVLFTIGRERPLGRLEVDLLPGREYRIICIFMNDPKSPPHFELGMYGSIRVSGVPTT